jgi:hypothetical protein
MSVPGASASVCYFAAHGFTGGDDIGSYVVATVKV